MSFAAKDAYAGAVVAGMSTVLHPEPLKRQTAAVPVFDEQPGRSKVVFPARPEDAPWCETMGFRISVGIMSSFAFCLQLRQTDPEKQL